MGDKAIGIVRTLAVGYILYFWSERAFWSFWRFEDTPKGAVIAWIAYSLLAAVLLALVRVYRVSSFAPLFLAGAVYGWLAEGGIVATMYGDPSNPLPLSLSWTGLAWHALLSVCLGWGWIGRALASRDARAVALRSAALGAGAGLWGVWWPSQTVVAFGAHTAVFTLGLFVAWWTLGRVPAPEGSPSRAGLAVLCLFVLAFLVFVRVPSTPVAAVVLPPLLLLCWVGLERSSQWPEAPNALAQTSGEFGHRECLGLFLLPVSATAVYGCLAWTHLPTNVIVYLVTMPLGFWFFGRGLWTTIRASRTREALSSVDSNV